MDLETENRIAAILMKEAAELRRQADKEGVHAYLGQPNVRFQPNSRFLTATVLGVQQANRAVDVNEMWNIRQKERELDDRLKRRVEDGSSTSKIRDYVEPSASRSGSGSSGCSSSKRTVQECYSCEDKGFKDDDIDEFLHSRKKRGRGDVGTRMDEPGPYLRSSLDPTEHRPIETERWGQRVILGPEKPRSLKSSKYDEEETLQDKQKKRDKSSSSKRNSKSKSKEKSKDRKKKKRKDERKSKRRR